MQQMKSLLGLLRFDDGRCTSESLISQVDSVSLLDRGVVNIVTDALDLLVPCHTDSRMKVTDFSR